MQSDSNESAQNIWSDPQGTIAMLRRLFSEEFRREYYGAVAIAVVCMLAGAATTAANAGLMRYVVNDIFVSQHASKIWTLGLAVAAIAGVRGFATYGQTVMLGRIGNAITATFQIRLIEKITRLKLSFFAANHSSKLVMRIARNAGAAQDVILMVSTSLGRDLVTVIALFGVMVYQDALMALIVVLFAPLVVFSIARLVRKIRELDSEEFATTSAVVGATMETIQGIGIVKAFSLEDEMRKRVTAAARGAEARANAIRAIQASTSPIMETLGGIAIATVIIYAGWQTTAMDKTPGEFMSFLTAFLLAYEPAKNLARLNVNLQRSLNRVRMIYSLLDDPEGEATEPGAIPVGRAKGSISFDSVDFGYRGKKKVLHGVTFEASPGEVVALVGPSGAGKSTVVNLLQRLYDPWAGTIAVDGTDISTISYDSLRANIALVSQDTFLFSGTISENIAMGRLTATDEEVRSAADAALVTEFAADLKDGLDTSIGENGAKLSGGQRQRVAIARAILKDAPILLLDEATSALDTVSEQKVRAAIAALTKGRTTIVVTHRLSTVVGADRIYVLKRGHIAETGTHEELMAMHGEYANLFGTGPKAKKLREAWEILES